MGKGGRSDAAATKAKGQARVITKPSHRINDEGAWISPYNPLDPKAPELPTKGEIKAAIPKECFERSYVHSMWFVLRDTAMAAALVYATNACLSTALPENLLSVEALTWFAGWNFYAFWMGTILTGHWVLAHEAGHGAFSP